MNRGISNRCQRPERRLLLLPSSVCWVHGVREENDFPAWYWDGRLPSARFSAIQRREEHAKLDNQRNRAERGAFIWNQRTSCLPAAQRILRDRPNSSFSPTRFAYRVMPGSLHKVLVDWSICKQHQTRVVDEQGDPSGERQDQLPILANTR